MLAEDHAGLRRSLVALLSREPEFEVIATAANGRQALELAEQLQPDVIIIDIRMPELDGLAATADLTRRRAKSPIVILTSSDAPAHVRQAFANGAAAYVLKHHTLQELIPAIHTALQGHTFVSPALAPVNINDYPPHQSGSQRQSTDQATTGRPAA